MRLLLPVVFVQPFADIVANYTCCDRNKNVMISSDISIYLLSAGGSAATVLYHLQSEKYVIFWLQSLKISAVQRDFF